MLKIINLPHRLRILRQVRDLKSKEMGELCEIHHYDRIEQGKQSPKLQQIETICEVLKIEIWELFAEELVIRFKEDEQTNKITRIRV